MTVPLSHCPTVHCLPIRVKVTRRSFITMSTQLTYSDFSILIVDDTPVNLAVLVDYLTDYGFNIRIARTGETALQRVHYDAPDLILLDALMPGIDGFETCRQLKADAVTAEIPVIFMTSLASAEDKIRGFEVGAVDYVTKPLQQAEVLARITTHLRQQNVKQQLRQENSALLASGKAERERLFAAVRQQRSQLRALTSKLTEVQERERRQLARELHDEMGQALTAIRMDLAVVEKGLPPTVTPYLRERLAEAAYLTEQTLEQVRELSLDLRPPMLDDLGLVPTLRWYVKRYSSRTAIQTGLTLLGTEQRLSATVETALYRVLQEALTNVARHAGAKMVQVTLHYQATGVIATVADNGCGFDVDAISAREIGSMGLLGMRERVSLLGGKFQIESLIGKGTTLWLELPLEEIHDDGGDP